MTLGKCQQFASEGLYIFLARIFRHFGRIKIWKNSLLGHLKFGAGVCTTLTIGQGHMGWNSLYSLQFTIQRCQKSPLSGKIATQLSKRRENCQWQKISTPNASCPVSSNGRALDCQFCFRGSSPRGVGRVLFFQLYNFITFGSLLKRFFSIFNRLRRLPKVIILLLLNSDVRKACFESKYGMLPKFHSVEYAQF